MAVESSRVYEDKVFIDIDLSQNKLHNVSRIYNKKAIQLDSNDHIILQVPTESPTSVIKLEPDLTSIYGTETYIHPTTTRIESDDVYETGHNLVSIVSDGTGSNQGKVSVNGYSEVDIKSKGSDSVGTDINLVPLKASITSKDIYASGYNKVDIISDGSNSSEGKISVNGYNEIDLKNGTTDSNSNINLKPEIITQKSKDVDIETSNSTDIVSQNTITAKAKNEVDIKSANDSNSSDFNLTPTTASLTSTDTTITDSNKLTISAKDIDTDASNTISVDASTKITETSPTIEVNSSTLIDVNGTKLDADITTIEVDGNTYINQKDGKGSYSLSVGGLSTAIDSTNSTTIKSIGVDIKGTSTLDLEAPTITVSGNSTTITNKDSFKETAPITELGYKSDPSIKIDSSLKTTSVDDTNISIGSASTAEIITVQSKTKLSETSPTIEVNSTNLVDVDGNKIDIDATTTTLDSSVEINTSSTSGENTLKIGGKSTTIESTTLTATTPTSVSLGNSNTKIDIQGKNKFIAQTDGRKATTTVQSTSYLEALNVGNGSIVEASQINSAESNSKDIYFSNSLSSNDIEIFWDDTRKSLVFAKKK